MTIRNIALLGLALAPLLPAEENLWTYTRGTDTRPEGSWELKVGDIWRTGKNSGSYHFHDIRPELEYGINDCLTVGAELMYFYHNYSVDDPDLNPMYETQGGAGGKFDEFQFGGFEVFAKYNILSPYKDPLGLSVAVGFEHRDAYRLDGADIDQDTVYGTLFLQKNYLDDRLTLALNAKMELERRKSPGVLEEEIAFDISGGVAYRFAPKWFAGIEARWQSDFLNPQEYDEAGAPGYTGEGFEEGYARSSWDLSDMRLGSQYQQGLYVGPSIHYAEKGWWVTAGVLYQVFGDGDDRNPSVSDGRNWDEHEKFHTSLVMGFEF